MTPSLEGWPIKAKVAPYPHEVRLNPAGHQPSISMSSQLNVHIEVQLK